MLLTHFNVTGAKIQVWNRQRQGQTAQPTIWGRTRIQIDKVDDKVRDEETSGSGETPDLHWGATTRTGDYASGV